MIKLLHVATVVITASLFILRGIWVLTGSSIMQQRWVRIVPHINDTLLLVTAIILAVTVEQYPFVHHWLTAKVIALLFYIGLGIVAMRSKGNKKRFILFWTLALLSLAYIIMVAHYRQVVWF